MNFEDIKEQSVEQLKAYWEKIKESTAYIQLKERYDQLNPRQQKWVNIGSVLLIFYFVISIPLGFLDEAANKEKKFKATTALHKNLVKTKDKLANAPQARRVVESGRLSRNLKDYFQKEGFTKDQITQNESFKEENKGQIPEAPGDAIITGVKIALKQLNLKQVVSVLHNAEKKAKPGIMTHVNITPTSEKAGYFDLGFEIRNFEIPKVEEPKEEPRRRRSRKKRN